MHLSVSRIVLFFIEILQHRIKLFEYLFKLLLMFPYNIVGFFLSKKNDALFKMIILIINAQSVNIFLSYHNNSPCTIYFEQ